MFDTKKELRWSKLKVGLVITIAFLVLCLAVFFAGNIQSLLSKKTELRIQFRDVVGLRKGAPVWILGLEEGSVKDITLDPVRGVIVTIAVNKNALQFVRQDSLATILTMGLLGDKYIGLSTGSPQAQPIRPGEMIKGSSEMGLREVMGQFIESLRLPSTAAMISGTGVSLGRCPEPVQNFEATKTLSRYGLSALPITCSLPVWL